MGLRKGRCEGRDDRQLSKIFLQSGAAPPLLRNTSSSTEGANRELFMLIVFLVAKILIDIVNNFIFANHHILKLNLL